MKAYSMADGSKTLGEVIRRYMTTDGQWRLEVERDNGSTIDADEREFTTVIEGDYTTCWQN